MSGTKIGGMRARQTNYLRHGLDFYSNIGRIGGKKGRTGGFASDVVGEDGLTGRERARIAGAKGGRKSKRGPAKSPAEKEAERAKQEVEDFNKEWYFEENNE